jgi:hypothetical protein
MASSNSASHADFKDTVPTDFGAEYSDDEGASAALRKTPANRLLTLLLGAAALAVLVWGALAASVKVVALGGLCALLAWVLSAAGRKRA